ncbi:Pyruvate/2-oxoglutarate dehydrogenase complex, dihydrolipoamide dehydrogenase (E3) component [Devosia sp. YR412]|uniref:FAD-containing oxidoreductase n=1 Tax=Devosia sp. YR412 TaxID=1881030 RepID=UPI0008D7F8D3|nr:FAD-containing oxidoreductase [Devosia sp. YR412]SEQ55420.1 Pyruvate/2-oxoglutarate dehydrogenase complex, dihydrolipoamide dehydrogenase (E3) component [Devosia sp. YR412]
MSEQFDAIIIGAGQSGPFLAAKLAGAGKKVALIEKEHLGGTCVNDGCTPTKTLVASARAAWSARHAAEFGVVLKGPVTVDMKAVKARKDKVVGASVKSLTDWIGSLKTLEYIKDVGSFVSTTEVKAGKRTLTSRQIFINAGATASVPDWPGINSVPYLTNTSMMNIDTLPSHLIIAGASYIGLEFAQMYARFGSKVTVIERGPRPASREDEDISAAIRDILEAEGVSFLFNTTIEAVAKAGHGVLLSLKSGERRSSVEGSHFLVALGRTPNSASLNLEAAGIETDERGYIPVDDHLRTKVKGIWAMGDINGRGAFTHTSYNDFEIVADNVLDGGRRSIAKRVPVYGLFIDPPLGRIGMSETEVRKSGKKALMAIMPMSKVSRAKERGETQGLMKVLVDAQSKEILGAAILGIGGDEIVHSLLQLMVAGTPYTTMMQTVHIHPTVTELIPTLLADLKPLQ